MNGSITNRDLLRAALAGIATALLVLLVRLLVRLLLAVALSGPVEALNRRKNPGVSPP